MYDHITPKISKFSQQLVMGHYFPGKILYLGLLMTNCGTTVPETGVINNFLSLDKHRE